MSAEIPHPSHIHAISIFLVLPTERLITLYPLWRASSVQQIPVRSSSIQARYPILSPRREVRHYSPRPPAITRTSNEGGWQGNGNTPTFPFPSVSKNSKSQYEISPHHHLFISVKSTTKSFERHDCHLSSEMIPPAAQVQIRQGLRISSRNFVVFQNK